MVCVLTSKSTILIYDIYGALILKINSNNQIAKFTTNPSTSGNFVIIISFEIIDPFIATLITDGTIQLFGIEIERLPIISNASNEFNMNSKNFEIKLNAKLLYIYDIPRHQLINEIERNNTASRNFSQVINCIY